MDLMVFDLNKKNLTAIVVFLVLGLVVGYFVALQNTPKQTLPPPEKQSTMFDSQNASFTGKATNFDGSKLTAVNSKGQAQTFSVSKSLVIIAPGANNKVASPSTDVRKLALNKDAYFYLQLINNDYQVISITYSGVLPVPLSKLK